jgi:hypothetical protein
MKPAGKKPAAANLRSWRVIIMRSRGEYLGSVEAPTVREPRLWLSSSSSWTRTSAALQGQQPL